MNDDAEPVIRLELSLFEAWAVYTHLVRNESETVQCVWQLGLTGHAEEAAALKQPLLTTQRTLTKVKAGLDAALLECKRRWPRQAAAQGEE
jgi:hypothetical protein